MLAGCPVRPPSHASAHQAVATAGRTREFGLRLALGARPGAVVGMVVRDALGLAAAGVALGALAALWTSRFLASLLIVGGFHGFDGFSDLFQQIAISYFLQITLEASPKKNESP